MGDAAGPAGDAAGAALAPDPERGLAPVPLAAEGGDRVVPAPDPVDGPIPREGVVVDLLEPRELGQDVRREPEEALGLADGAEGDLQVPRRPRTPPARAGPRRTAGRSGPSRRDGRPPAARSRRSAGRPPARRGPRRARSPKDANRPSSRTRQVLVGDLARPVVVLDADGRARPPPSAEGTRIDDDLGMSLSTIRLSPDPAGRSRDRGDGEVLHPDARMEQLGLMAGHDQGRRRVGDVRDVEPEAAHGRPATSRATCRRDQVAEPAGRSPLEVVVPAARRSTFAGQA